MSGRTGFRRPRASRDTPQAARRCLPRCHIATLRSCAGPRNLARREKHRAGGVWRDRRSRVLAAETPEGGRGALRDACAGANCARRCVGVAHRVERGNPVPANAAARPSAVIPHLQPLALAGATMSAALAGGLVPACWPACWMGDSGQPLARKTHIAGFLRVWVGGRRGAVPS